MICLASLQVEEHRQQVDHLNTAKTLLVQELETAQSKLTSQVFAFVSVIVVQLSHIGDIDNALNVGMEWKIGLPKGRHGSKENTILPSLAL